MTPTCAATFAGPDGWRLDADGAALHDATGTAVIADVHLGYEWARGHSGDVVPAHSLDETITRIARIHERMNGRMIRLVVAGDLVESSRPCWRTQRDVAVLRGWLGERGVELVALQGNHDPPRRAGAHHTLTIGGWTIAHGHQPLDAPRTITGHHHPVLRASGITAPCFLIHASMIILPAFSRNAAGVSLDLLPLEAMDLSALRCVATAEGTILDFGPVRQLVSRFRS